MGARSSKVDIYWNLHKGVWSLRCGGIVRYHAHNVMASGISFVVQPAGRSKVLSTERKNVHAFVRAECIDLQDPQPIPVPKDFIRVRYNPYRWDSFVDSNFSPIYEAEEVILTYDGLCYAKIREVSL